jgi:hypothetical protein
MPDPLWLSLVWLAAASLLGFVLSAVFSGWLQLSRPAFLIPYTTLSGLFLVAFFLWNDVNLAALLVHNWAWGLLAGALASLILIANVRSQPASRQSSGVGLVGEVAWLGLVYGIVDALFLNVMPVLAVWGGLSQAGWIAGWPGRIAAGGLALAASLLVTFTYHVGYPEFRNARVGLVLVGNGVISLAYLLSINPLGSIISHTIMHVAAVFRGAETVLQLPPHYAVPDRPRSARSNTPVIESEASHV